MEAIILAGGKGTRLSPLTDNLPKPLVKIIDKPVIELIISKLRTMGIIDIRITVSHMWEKIVSALGDGRDVGVNITYHVEEVPLGTAGGVKNASKDIEGDFLVVSGDAFFDLDLENAVRYHRETSSLLTLIAKSVDDPTGLGVLETDDEGVIKSFVEKPTEKTGRSLINTGIYVVSKPVMNLVPDGAYDFGRDLIPRLTGICRAYVSRGYWSDIGTLESYYYANYLAAKKRRAVRG